MTNRLRAVILTVVPPLLLAGCVATSRSINPIAERSCTVGMSSVAPPESISVATTSAPVARFIFAQAWETLINVDCEGRVYPGLARSWTTDASKTRVTLTLRDGARFWNGEPLGAGDVVAAWRAMGASSADSGQTARRLAESTTIIDDRTLIVSLPDTEWRVLAYPALAVNRRATGWSWPMGSGPYRATDFVGDLGPGRLALISKSAQRTLNLSVNLEPDPRDAIDAGVDLVLGAEPSIVNYASRHSELETIPLPWSRGYALAIPGRVLSGASELLAGDSAAAFRASLARDAVRAEARAAEPANWWTSTQGCQSGHEGMSPSPGVRAQPSRRIVYNGDDHVARELAERLVAVGRHATATSLPRNEFARALRAGTDLAYVVALPRASLAACHDLASLISSMPWLGENGAVNGAFIPLIETRERAIVKRGHISATIDWDGTLRMNGASGWGPRP